MTELVFPVKFETIPSVMQKSVAIKGRMMKSIFTLQWSLCHTLLYSKLADRDYLLLLDWLDSVLRRIGNISAIYNGRPVSEKWALNADSGWSQACEHFSSCFKASPLFMSIDWLIDWIEFYTVSAISHPCYGGHDDRKKVFVKQYAQDNGQFDIWPRSRGQRPRYQ